MGLTIYTIYAGDHVWADFDQSGPVTARYLFGDRIDEIIARWLPSDGTAWYLSFGNILSQTNTAVGDRFTYTGRE